MGQIEERMYCRTFITGVGSHMTYAVYTHTHARTKHFSSTVHTNLSRKRNYLGIV